MLGRYITHIYIYIYIRYQLHAYCLDWGTRKYDSKHAMYAYMCKLSHPGCETNICVNQRIGIKIWKTSRMKIHLKLSFAKRWLFGLCLDMVCSVFYGSLLQTFYPVTNLLNKQIYFSWISASQIAMYAWVCKLFSTMRAWLFWVFSLDYFIRIQSIYISWLQQLEIYLILDT